MAHFDIKNGHNFLFNVPIDKNIEKIGIPNSIKLHPRDFPDIKPKVLLKEGESFNKGAPIYRCKNNEKILFTSPLAGEIKKINYGERRKIESIDILVSNDQNSKYYDDLFENLNDTDSDKITEILCKSGLWPLIRTKPFSKIADPLIMPNSIFISTNPTAPFSPDLEFILEGKIKEVQKGIDILHQISNSNIHLTTKTNGSIFNDLKNVVKHTSSGKHPAGNIGVHIYHVDPIKNKEDVVWYISPQALYLIGQLFLYKDINYKKVVLIGGYGFTNNKYYEVYYGTQIEHILKRNNLKDNSNLISGDILSGDKTTINNALGFYDETLSSIKISSDREFLGWIMPGLRKYTLTKSFLSSFINLNKTKFTTLKNGSIRSIIPIGNIEKYIPYDILITPLIKAILAKDIDSMEKLGIYECSPEDFSLCTYVDASKLNISTIIKEGLDYMEIEG